MVLFHPDGRVWYGHRVGTTFANGWQFPQGGVDEGEDLYQAAVRELAEETGVRSTTLLGRTDDWLVYDFPPEAAGSKIARGWLGQKQVWFALRFDGEADEIDLEVQSPAEFDAWRWDALAAAPNLIVPFKRAVYDQVVQAFARFV